MLADVSIDLERILVDVGVADFELVAVPERWRGLEAVMGTSASDARAEATWASSPSVPHHSNRTIGQSDNRTLQSAFQANLGERG